MKKIELRPATVNDAALLLEIYRPYIENTAVTLEYDVPSVAEFAGRIRDITAEFPYIVAECNGEPVGYAYAHKYRPRYGFRFCAELSVYVGQTHTKMGLGRVLYSTLIDLLSEMHYKNLYGIVVDPNTPSFRLHEEFGFREVGRDHYAGFKFGKWYDVVTLERLTGEHTDGMGCFESPLRFGELDKAKVGAILTKYVTDAENL